MPSTPEIDSLLIDLSVLLQDVVVNPLDNGEDWDGLYRQILIQGAVNDFVNVLAEKDNETILKNAPELIVPLSVTLTGGSGVLPLELIKILTATDGGGYYTYISPDKWFLHTTNYNAENLADNDNPIYTYYGGKVYIAGRVLVPTDLPIIYLRKALKPIHNIQDVEINSRFHNQLLDLALAQHLKYNPIT